MIRTFAQENEHYEHEEIDQRLQEQFVSLAQGLDLKYHWALADTMQYLWDTYNEAYYKGLAI